MQDLPLRSGNGYFFFLLIVYSKHRCREKDLHNTGCRRQEETDIQGSHSLSEILSQDLKDFPGHFLFNYGGNKRPGWWPKVTYSSLEKSLKTYSLCLWLKYKISSLIWALNNTLQQMSFETNFSTIAKKSKYLFLLFTYFEIIIQKCNQLIINANNNIY